MNPTRAPFQSARGLAHSKTWRTSQRPRAARSVLDCGSPLPLFPRDAISLKAKFPPAAIPREEALFALALEKPADPSKSDRFQMSLDPIVKRREDLSHMLHAFAHPVPLDLKTVAVVDDMPEATEGAELTRQSVVEQHGQRWMAGRAEALEQIIVPVLACGQRDAMEPAQAFENVFEAGVKLGEESRRGCFLSHRRLTVGHVHPECFEFVRRLAQGRELDGDLSSELLGRHKSTRARFSISRVKGVGGSSGTKSSGTPSDSSSAAENSKNFQPGTPAHARSRSRACAGFSNALPNSSNRVAPNCRAKETTFVSTVSKSIIAPKLPRRLGTDNDKLSNRVYPPS